MVDLTDHRGEVGPYVLAELGADVIKLEPPGGNPARQQAFQFAAYNANKRSVVIDPGDPAGEGHLVRLLASADVVFRSQPSEPPEAVGLLGAGGLTHEDLVAANPAVVDVVVTPFGPDGPREGDPASELVLAALGGSANLQGTPDRPPVGASIPQVWRHAGAEAAVGAMMARARQRLVGGSQLVTVSAQCAVTWTLLNAMEAHAICGRDTMRSGTVANLATPLQLRMETKDGFAIVVSRGVAIGHLVEWLIEEGIVDQRWRDEEWDTFDARANGGEPVEFSFGQMTAAVAELCSRYRGSELLERSLDYHETIAPVHTVADLLALGHLHQRDYWAPGTGLTNRSPGAAADDAQAEIDYVGGFVCLDGTRVGGRRQPPAVGEHTDLVLGELVAAEAVPSKGLAGSDGPSRAAPTSGQQPPRLVFEGLKVADFSWIGVGPITAKAFADHGATVVRVESRSRLDGLRVNPPFKDDVVDIDMAHFFGTFNTSKLSIDVDLTNSGGVSVAHRLIEWADVVIESWTPGTFGRVVADDDTIRELNPGLVLVHTSLMASGGDLERAAGFGYHAAALAGFYPTVGWPDRPPDGPYLAYTDTISPRLITTSVAAALEQRERTGEGCVIEAAQLECGLTFLAPELLDCQATGTVVSRNGNRVEHCAPQGVYPTAGDDRWIAITVDSDACWLRFAEAMGQPDWARDAELENLAGRTGRHDWLDDEIAGVTRGIDGRELERTLTGAGVPAGVVQRSSDLLADPQYGHLRFYRYLEHPKMGVVPYAGHQYRIDGYDHGPRTAAPTLGQHTHEVLVDLLGLSDDEVADLAIAGAFG